MWVFPQIFSNVLRKITRFLAATCPEHLSEMLFSRAACIPRSSIVRFSWLSGKRASTVLSWPRACVFLYTDDAKTSLGRWMEKMAFHEARFHLLHRYRPILVQRPHDTFFSFIFTAPQWAAIHELFRWDCDFDIVEGESYSSFSWTSWRGFSRVSELWSDAARVIYVAIVFLFRRGQTLILTTGCLNREEKRISLRHF